MQPAMKARLYSRSKNEVQLWIWISSGFPDKPIKILKKVAQFSIGTFQANSKAPNAASNAVHLFSNENVINLRLVKKLITYIFPCRRNQQLSDKITFLLICLTMFNQPQEQNIH